MPRDEDQTERLPTIKEGKALSTIHLLVAIGSPLAMGCAAVMSPYAKNFIKSAAADEIAGEVQKQIAPTNEGLRVMIESQIQSLEEDISQLEWRQMNQPKTWTEADSLRLSSKRRLLSSQRQALSAMSAAQQQRGQK